MQADKPDRQRNPLLEAVGLVTIAGAHLEARLRNLLSCLAQEPTLLKLANTENTGRLIYICELAVEGLDVPEQDRAALSACLKEAGRLQEARSRVVHSLLLHNGNGIEVLALKPARKSLGVNQWTATIEGMERTAHEIEELRFEMFRCGWNSVAHKAGMSRIPETEGEQHVHLVTGPEAEDPTAASSD
ncbi:hypothetical protein [Streptosporangium nondiastaticum]|uniref:hypothetical protein n=1 Tax=Streptosporangium nondiastaticum TaxID=35764 RepID=UPI0011B252BB|nr:hypothetical protein [Streptosporangium nondiastaticum]